MSSSASLVTGTCNCGKHKYTVPKPEQMNLCHCLDCRKWAGAFHSAHVFIKDEDIRDNGSPAPKTWSNKADSGAGMERAFCDECGAGLWLKANGFKGMTFMKAGLFEPKDIPKPTMENWLKNKHDWESTANGDHTKAQDNGF